MYVHTYIATYYIPVTGDVPNSPALIYKSTLNEILLSFDSDIECGLLTYNVTVMPSHGMIMMINDTAYNITGLHYNTNYTITVYATNNVGDGEPAVVIVKTNKPGTYMNVALY